MENNYNQQLTEAMKLAYINAKKIIAVENKQKPFISIKMTQTTLEICIN
jgi:hypothetical protein